MMINPTEIGEAAKNAATSVIHALREAAAQDTSEPRLFFPHGIQEIEVRFSVTEPDGTQIEFEMDFEGAEADDMLYGGDWYEDDDVLGDDETEDEAETEISKN
jgi:hypothetical protein